MSRRVEAEENCGSACKGKGREGHATPTDAPRKVWLGSHWLRSALRAFKPGETAAAQRKALFTSGFVSTTSAQIPTGIPSKQQGDVQGIIAKMLAATARP